MSRHGLRMLALLLPASLALAQTPRPSAANTEFPKKDTAEASVYRGAIVFEHYCILCHGSKADGAGRAAKLYNPKPANLVTSDKNSQYKELIIRQGGKALGRSEYMPPWNNELSDEQIADTVAFLASISSTKPSKP